LVDVWEGLKGKISEIDLLSFVVLAFRKRFEHRHSDFKELNGNNFSAL